MVDELLDEGCELGRIGTDEGRRPVEMVRIPWGPDDRVGFHVVQVGARTQLDVRALDGFVKIAKECRVGPCLVGGMADLAHGASDEGADDAVLLCELRLRPLLQLDDDGRAAVAVVATGQDEVDALGGLWNPVLDGDTGVSGNVFILQNIAHVQH